MGSNIELENGQKDSDTSILNSTRLEYYEALTQYYIHARYTTSRSISVLVALLFGLFTGIVEDKYFQYFQLLCGLSLIASFMLMIIAIRNLKLYYWIYTSALVFAFLVHSKSKFKGLQPWLERLDWEASKYAKLNDINSEKTWSYIETQPMKFVKWRSSRWHNALNMHRLILYIIAFISLICGVFLFIISIKASFEGFSELF